MAVGSETISVRSGSTNGVAPTPWYRCQAELRSRQKSFQADALGLYVSLAIGKRVHSGPISGVQGARHSTMVTEQPLTSTSTRT